MSRDPEVARKEEPLAHEVERTSTYFLSPRCPADRSTRVAGQPGESRSSGPRYRGSSMDVQRPNAPQFRGVTACPRAEPAVGGDHLRARDAGGWPGERLAYSASRGSSPSGSECLARPRPRLTETHGQRECGLTRRRSVARLPPRCAGESRNSLDCVASRRMRSRCGSGDKRQCLGSPPDLHAGVSSIAGTWHPREEQAWIAARDLGPPWVALLGALGWGPSRQAGPPRPCPAGPRRRGLILRRQLERFESRARGHSGGDAAHT